MTSPHSAAVRYHYMDNLRAAAMLVGVVFHAMLAYVPNMQNLWLSASPDNSAALGAIAWFLHLFRMPLFFLIAGFFACYLARKRGTSGFLKNRSLRLLLPFLIFLPVVLLGVVGPISWALEHVENRSPMLGVIDWMQSNPDAPAQPLSTMHLWFLWNLYFFVIVYALLQTFGAGLSTLADRLLTPRVIVLLLPLLLVPALASLPQPHPAPEKLYPQAWSFGYYGVFFLLGSFYYRTPELLDRLKPYALPMLVSSIAMYAVLYAKIPKTMTLEEGVAIMQAGWPVTAEDVLLGVLEAYISLHMTLLCLIAGKAFLDRASRPVRYIADSSYWIYVMHLPTVFFIQYLLLDRDWNMWLELTLSSMGTILLGLMSYALFIRWTPIGWMLNGRRSTRQEAVATA